MAAGTGPGRPESPTLTPQSAVHGLVAWASSGSLLEMQNLRPHLRIYIFTRCPFTFQKPRPRQSTLVLTIPSLHPAVMYRHYHSLLRYLFLDCGDTWKTVILIIRARRNVWCCCCCCCFLMVLASGKCGHSLAVDFAGFVPVSNCSCIIDDLILSSETVGP